jgi:hypothetical protein
MRLKSGLRFWRARNPALTPFTARLFFRKMLRIPFSLALSPVVSREEIANRFAGEMKLRDAELAPYPAQSWAVAPLRAAALAQGRTDLVHLWTGQSAYLLRYRMADEIFASLVRETEEVFKTRAI